MFCVNCGTRLEQDAAFCQNCGARVVKQVSSVQPLVSHIYTAPPVYKEPSMVHPHYTAVYSPQYSEEYIAKKKRGKFAIASFILSLFGMIPCFINIIPAVLALIFSIIGIRSDRKGRAITSLIFAIIGIFIAIVMIFSFLEPEASALPYLEEFFGDELYF